MPDFLINPRRLDELRRHMLSQTIESQNIAAIGNDAQAGDWYEDYLAALEKRGSSPFAFSIENGIAIIPIRGALVSTQIEYWHCYGSTTYESIVATIESAVGNSEVKSVLLRINSPGGTVTGCAEAAEAIDKLSEIKPIWSQCSMADSAAYWLASATNQIVVDKTGEVGSIGVITTHMDMSKMLEEWGIKVTHIFSGSHKADGSPYAPLTEAAQERMQADIDHLRDIFVETVAGYRGMTPAAIKDTEALTYIGTLAVEAGLADATGYITDVTLSMAALDSAGIQPTAKKQETSKMAKTGRAAIKPKASDTTEEDTEEKKKNESSAAEDGDDDEEDKATKKAEESDDEDQDEGDDEGDEDKEASASATERKRVSSILNHKEAQGRSSLAQHLALNTTMSVKDAAAALAASPKGAAANPLSEAMAREGNPSVGAGTSGKPANANALLEDMKSRFK